MMSTDLDDLFKEVAAKHGVALSRDDPIMVLYTLCDRVAASAGQHQAEQLEHFKQEMEGLTSRWSFDTKAKAEQVITVSLTASKVAMSETVTAVSLEASDRFKKDLEHALQGMRTIVAGVHRAAVINLAASAITIVAAAIAFYSSI